MSALLKEHFGYLSDAVKVRRYREAIAKVVRGNDVVADLGCGSGVLGLACLRAGARFVHCIDETPFIDVARRTLTDAGYGLQAAFHRARSQHIELPERVDVLVCDHVGFFGVDYGILGMLADAQRRFLKPGGAVIPAELRLSVAGVESETCRNLVDGWRGDQVPSDYHWVGDLAAEAKHPVDLAAADLISESAEFATIIPGAEVRSFFSRTADLIASRDGGLDGVAGWFDCRLGADVWMTNSPNADERLQRPQAFLPLSRPVPLAAGDAIRVTVMARPGDHLLRWIVELPASGQRFAHSTWNGLLLDHADLARAKPDRVATLNARGHARQIILGYCDGTRTAQAVEQQVLRDHPDLFPSVEELSRFVARVLGTDTGA